MHDRIQASKPLIVEPPPEGFGRDPRIDACRGIALWWIYLDHIPNNIGSWLTLRNYGFSDAAEVFMFISGVTCALAYGKARRCAGWSGVIRRSLRRAWDIYAAFLLLMLACAIMVYLSGRGHLADESNTRLLLEHPGAALAHAAILQYRPVNTDILPMFVVYHALFAPLLWLLLRAPNLTLGASLVLYALVHVFSWNVPAWPYNFWFFNPLAWQLLIVLGAWWVIEEKRLRWYATSRTALALAVLYLAFSLIVALSWHIKLLEPLIPQTLTNLLFPAYKSNLSPLRVLHVLALAILAVRFVPHTWPRPMMPLMRGAMRCGENSLPIYCLGVLLAFASHMALLDFSDGVPMQIALSLAGILIMIIAAILLNSIKIKPSRQPPHDDAPAHGDFSLVRSGSIQFGRHGGDRFGFDASAIVVGRPVRFAGGNLDEALVMQRYQAAFERLGAGHARLARVQPKQGSRVPALVHATRLVRRLVDLMISADSRR